MRKNGIVTFPVVDADNVSLQDKENLAAEERSEWSDDSSFVWCCLQAFFLSEVVRSR